MNKHWKKPEDRVLSVCKQILNHVGPNAANVACLVTGCGGECNLNAGSWPDLKSLPIILIFSFL